MKLPYGIAWITWDKLSPKEILAVSKSFIDPGAPDAADRQWRCAVFASETGQTEAARELAEAAARMKPEYKEQIAAAISRDYADALRTADPTLAHALALIPVRKGKNRARARARQETARG